MQEFNMVHARCATHHSKGGFMLTIDRFEGDFTVVEVSNQGMINIPKSDIPKDAKEGDVLKIIIDNEETSKRKNSVNDMMSGLFI